MDFDVIDADGHVTESWSRSRATWTSRSGGARYRRRARTRSRSSAGSPRCSSPTTRVASTAWP